MYDLEEIRGKIDLAALIGEKVALKRSGESLTGMCPFHDNHRTPALAVWPKTKTWKCFGCGKAGDCFAWWMELHQCEFTEAVAELARMANLSPAQSTASREGKREAPAATPLSQGPGEAWRVRALEFLSYCHAELLSERGAKAREYLERERGLWPETWDEFYLGYNPKNIYDDPTKWGLSDGHKVWLSRGLVIPGFMRGGIPWYVKIRRPRPSDSLAQYIGGLERSECISDAGRLNPDDDPKFGGPRGGTACLFRANENSGAPIALMVEGEWDTMLSWQFGRDLADVATLGGAGKHLEMRDMALLTRYAAIGLVMDDDQAGDRARARWQKLEALHERLAIIQPPAHDLTDFWKAQGWEALRMWLASQAAGLLERCIAGISEGAEYSVPEGWSRRLAWALEEGGTLVSAMNTAPAPLPEGDGGRGEQMALPISGISGARYE